MKRKLLFVIILAANFYGFSQNNLKIIDSLKQVIQSKPSDSIKIKAFSDLCWYYRNISMDSAFVYGDLALNLSKKTNNSAGEAQAYNDIGILHYSLADYSKSLNHYRQSLKIRLQLKDTLGVAGLYNKIGLVHQNTFKMDSAIFYATKALKIYENKNNLRYAAVLKNNIANIYKGLKQYKKALNAHLEIAKVNEEIKDYKALTRSYNNIANAYLFLKDTVKCVEYYKKGIQLADDNVFENELAALYNNYGGILKSKGDYKSAINMISKSLKLREKLKNNYGISSSALNLGGLYLDGGQIEKSKKYLRLGLNLAEKSNANELKMDAYDKLSSYYAFKKNPDSVIHYKNLFKAVKDTIFSKQVIKEIAEVQEKYDTAEREKEILLQRADIAEKELNLNQKNTQLLGLGILAIVIAILGYLLFNQQKLKNAQLKKESELKEALVKIETQNRLQEQRLRISRDLHDNIGAQLTFIISSIDNLKYGFKITNDKINNKLSSISTFTKDTIYELRDTIWAMNKSEISLEDLQARVSNFVDKASVSENKINFNFKIDESFSKDLQFTSVNGMNIYRIIQEALNNAIKYAEASNINVEIKKELNTIQFSINDDGIGFDKSEIELGNGLNNIKKRAQDINAIINIESVLGKGTSVKLTV